ncbi:MAG: bifunctional folylpolyglutamate synthase/dihydrofolate synthase [Flavobacteriales bacterium]|nr:bifunctional folylpolyglutamate synthase/dihydrofolate synthase [Flavobacteriales bacterium]MBT6013479.1 bifunctional folylpolyglutamate synthase/dihydrofolate synthase [Flavobacteriales bacterium]MBT7481204.1 bifunctional folylpolyglutamate synthase/dihydrofolate synthase [Flavobacteriales bacterium]
MNYSETIEYLFNKLPIYQRSGKSAYKADIGNIVKASEILGNPHLNFKSVHIAGTNGKGSTAHMISSVLQESGYKVGLYTSPHLKDFRERIRINGEMISEKSVIEFVGNYKKEFEEIDMSFFEMTVAMAFHHFSEEKVDIAIIETGLGGRLDSTNIINPLVSVITNIGIDHAVLLGNTIEEIATEKAGIIKENTPVIIGREQKECEDIFIKKSKEKNSVITFCSGETKHQTDLKGNYQLENVRTTLFTIKKIQEEGFIISERNIKKGLLNVVKNTSLLGRWQILNKQPLTICDTAHNEDGIGEITKQLKTIKYDNLHFILGTVNDKNIDKILSLLPSEAKYYFCQADIPRSLDKELLQNKSSKYLLFGNTYTSVKSAYSNAILNAEKDDCIFIGGSTFIVAEII